MKTTATTITHIPEVTSLSSVNPKTFYTLQQTITSEEPVPTTDGPSKEGGKKKHSAQSQRKGIIRKSFIDFNLGGF